MEQKMSLEEYKKAVEEEAKRTFKSAEALEHLMSMPDSDWELYFDVNLTPAEMLLAWKMGY